MSIRIAHVADIHVRNLSRHSEYKSVIEAFVDKCKQGRVDHIYIGGDLYHTKTSGMSPECIEFMCWMLEHMASACEVHITLGNHDGNLVNHSRQDAVSPLVSALRNDRVHLYKSSGVYEFHPGYNWCVFSLFDDDWDAVKPVPGMVNIACYHGPVRGALTETGWLINDGTVSVDMFKGYDAVMLGDIHLRQVVAERGTVG